MFHNIKLYLIAVCAFMMSITASFGIVCNAPWVPNANDDACVCNDILYNGNCIESKFEIETTPIATGDYFAFQIQSKGEFYVDWGDGYVEPLTASLDTVTLKTYAHKYTGTTQSYRIKFGGRATSYYVDYSNNRPVIMFGSLAARAPDNTTDVATVNASNVRTKLYKIYGSLGRIFSGIPGEQMFYGTFAGCSNLVGTDIPDPNNPGMNYAIPPTLFDGVAGRPMAGMFTSTFSGCSSLTGSIPANLFSGISGEPAYQMFTSTFSGCSGLTGSIPETLFAGISGAPATYMFSATFNGCSGLTGPIPDKLFGNLTGAPVEGMFVGTFFDCTNLGKNSSGESVYYIPPTLFTGIDKTSPSYMGSMFANTGLLQSCSVVGKSDFDTGFNSSFDGRVSCYSPGTYNITYHNVTFNGETINMTGAPSQYTNNVDTPLNKPTRSGYMFIGWYDNAQLTGYPIDIIYKGSNGNIELYAKWIKAEFEIETTQIETGGDFAFEIAAQGEFYVDWGDGTVEQLTASLNTTDVKLYARKYTGATQSYRIRLGGHATAYNTSEYNTNPVISFAGYAPWAYTANAKAGISGANRRNEYLYKIYGSLGRIFSGVPVPYMFYRTFYYCNELTGTIPDDLFSGISGQSAPYIFYETFLLCSGLTGSIPTNLFSNFTGAADYMFRGTFAGCYNLGKDSLTMESAYYIPPTLFAGLAPDPLVQDPMSYVFESTGLWQSCPTGTNQAITGFEDAFDNRVSCIDSDYLYCRKEFKYDTKTKKCVACDKSVETCPTFGATYKCPDGYVGNSNSTECSSVYTITYHLNGGVNNQDNPSKYTDENLPINLKQPTKDGYNFVGWCTDAELTDCSYDVTIDSGANEEYWAKWEFDCPANKYIDGLMGLERAWFDLNGDGAQSLDECISTQFTLTEETYMLFEVCMIRAICAEEPELAPMVFDMSCEDEEVEAMLSQFPACDYDTAGISYMTCRYNADTYNAAGKRYTDCSTLVNVRNHGDLLDVSLPFFTNRNDVVSAYAGVFSAELKAKCIDSSAENPYSNPDDNYWDDYFGQDISSLISQIDAETITGSQAFGTLQSVEVCACKTVEVSVLSAPMCLIDFGHKTQKALSVKGSNGNVYYINLTAANPSEPTQLSSGHTLRIIAKSGVYEATDVISSGE